MKVKFRQPKGLRTFKGSVKIRGKNNRIPWFFGLENEDDPLLVWCDKLGVWVDLRTEHNDMYPLSSINESIKSVKAAIRHVKKHDEIPKGTRMLLVSNFHGCSVEITK